ncbi:hypothetical protein NicSoilC5_02750 [Arthrobacter sp. NicSoilC5]|nr:hypothetical protein NicSoilC5_02750 [Arthrobacter sp. NicSoilC5]
MPQFECEPAHGQAHIPEGFYSRAKAKDVYIHRSTEGLDVNKHSSHPFSPRFCPMRSTEHRALYFRDGLFAAGCMSAEKSRDTDLPASLSGTPAANRSPEVRDLLPWLGWVTE